MRFLGSWFLRGSLRFLREDSWLLVLVRFLVLGEVLRFLEVPP